MRVRTIEFKGRPFVQLAERDYLKLLRPARITATEALVRTKT